MYYTGRLKALTSTHTSLDGVDDTLLHGGCSALGGLQLAQAILNGRTTVLRLLMFTNFD